MTEYYDWDGDQLVREGRKCPNCGSFATEFRPLADCWKCEDCSTVWSGDQNPPEPDPESKTCPRCEGDGEVPDPDIDGPHDPFLAGSYIECPYCGGVGTV